MPKNSLDFINVINNLGIAKLILYNYNGNTSDLKNAIEAFQIAVDFPQDNPPARAKFLCNLGNSLKSLYSITGELSLLDKAISALRESVELTQESSPDAPGFLNNLSFALIERFKSRKESNDLDEAIELSNKATNLSDETSLDFPLISNTLGYVLINRYRAKRDQLDLENAIKAYQKALSLLSEKSPQIASILMNIGAAFLNKYELKEEHSDLENALDVWLKARKLMPEGSLEVPSILSNVGGGYRYLFERTRDFSDLEKSFRAYYDARLVLDSIFPGATIAHKRKIMSEWGHIDDKIVEIAIILYHNTVGVRSLYWAKKAFVSAEGSKARILTELLGHRDVPRPSSLPQEFIDKESDILKELTNIDILEFVMIDQKIAKNEEIKSKIVRIERRNQLLNELDKVWEKIKSIGYEEAKYIALRRGGKLSWEDIQNLANISGEDTALLSLYILTNSIVIFVMRSGFEGPKIAEISIDTQNQKELLSKFIKEVHEDGVLGRLNETWAEKLVPLFESISPYLENINRIIFAANAYGHLLPWSSIAEKARLDIPLINIPSLWTMEKLIRVYSPAKGPDLVVGNPTGDLYYAEQEAYAIAKVLNTKPLIGPVATKVTILERLTEARIAHLATHAQFNYENPFETFIKLANNELLKAKDILYVSMHPALLTLSACETGIVGSFGGNEIVGLSQVMLQAGAASLIVSLWSVDDHVTKKLMIKFYNYWINDGINKAEALHKAMGDIRKDWPHTYYCSPFILIGYWL